MPLIRLQKFLSAAGVCSRRRGEEFIRSGRITVNGETIVELGIKIDPETDLVAPFGSADFQKALEQLRTSKGYYQDIAGLSLAVFNASGPGKCSKPIAPV